MKRFLLKLVVFGLFLAPVVFLADFLLSRNMRNVNTYGMETWKDIMEGTAGSEILIQGDSRALNSCDGEVLDSIVRHSAYNLAIVGNPFVVQEFRYRMYREHNPKPRVLIQFVDDFLLSPNMSLDDPVQFLPWMWDKSFRREMYAFGLPILFREGVPLFRYQGSRPWSVERHERQSKRGFYTYDDDVFHHFAGNKWWFRYTEETDGRFRDFLRNAAAEGIRVVLVCPPFHESIEFGEGEEERMLGYYSALSEDLALPFYNGLSLEMVHDSTYFLDRGHLNAKGARVFTDSLATYLSGLGLFEDPSGSI